MVVPVSCLAPVKTVNHSCRVLPSCLVLEKLCSSSLYFHSFIPFTKTYKFWFVFVCLFTAAYSLVSSQTFSVSLGIGICDTVLRERTWEVLCYPIYSCVFFVFLLVVVIMWVLHGQARFPICTACLTALLVTSDCWNILFCWWCLW